MIKITEMEEYTTDVKSVYESEKKLCKKLKNARVFKEYEDGRQLLADPDGGFIMHMKGSAREEMMYGVAFKCEGELNDENLALAKKNALERLLEIVRELANTIPDEFFVIKDTETIKEEYRNPPLEIHKISDEEIDAINYFTVGCKMKLPNVYKEQI